MSTEEAALAATLDRFRFAYLATVGQEQRAHIVAVRPELHGDVFRIRQPGRTSGRNIGQHQAVTLVWPPADVDDYSLIVDGTGTFDGEELVVTPTRAVLHRPAPSPTHSSTGCESDCVELSLHQGT